MEGMPWEIISCNRPGVKEVYWEKGDRDRGRQTIIKRSRQTGAEPRGREKRQWQVSTFVCSTHLSQLMVPSHVISNY